MSDPVKIEVEFEELHEIYIELMSARNPKIVYTGQDIETVEKLAKQKSSDHLIRASYKLRQLFGENGVAIENNFFEGLK